jgi:drug/metabolite transporter (DMT)-like permease
MHLHNLKLSNTLLYVVTVLVWGTTWIGIEFQLGDVAPEVSVFYRYALASLLLFAWCRWRALQLRFNRRSHLLFALLGALLFSVNYIMTYYAQEYITSALTAIAFSTMLWMNIANSRLFFGTRAGRGVLMGSILGVAGILFLFVPKVATLTFTDATFYGASLAVVGAFIASLGNMVSQAAQNRKLPVVQSNAWGMFYGALFTGLIAIFSGRQFSFDFSAPYVLSLAYLSVFGSIVAFGAYLTLLGRIGAHKAGYSMVMFPVVAIIISVLFEGLILTIETVVGIVLVLFGNVLILKSRDKSSGENQPQSAAGRAFRYVLEKQR